MEEEIRNDHFFQEGNIHTLKVRIIGNNDQEVTYRFVVVDGDDDRSVLLKKKIIVKKNILESLNESESYLIIDHIAQSIRDLSDGTIIDDLKILSYPAQNPILYHLKVAEFIKTFFYKVSGSVLIMADIYRSMKIDWYCLQKSFEFFKQHGIIKEVMQGGPWTSEENWLTKLNEIVLLLKNEINDESQK